MNLCISGGALGADIAWGEIARSVGHDVIHWSFKGHKSKAEHDVYILDDVELVKADSSLAQANLSLKRKWPLSNQHVANLLRRNYWQIIQTDAVYAISSLVNDNSLLKIAGGTAWAATMYIDRCSNEGIIPFLYLFNQIDNFWYHWTNSWQKISKPPIPNRIYAGIGNRDLSSSGLKAIQEVYS